MALNYSESDLIRMQRDAEARVREMQNRARETVNATNQSSLSSSSSQLRNWSNNPNFYRRRSVSPHFSRPPKLNQASSDETKSSDSAPQSQNSQSFDEQKESAPPQANNPPETKTKKDSTIIGDIMGALNLDEDYLLIIGLMLILINQRADTTLILALAYLLI